MACRWGNLTRIDAQKNVVLSLTYDTRDVDSRIPNPLPFSITCLDRQRDPHTLASVGAQSSTSIAPWRVLELTKHPRYVSERVNELRMTPRPIRHCADV